MTGLRRGSRGGWPPTSRLLGRFGLLGGLLGLLAPLSAIATPAGAAELGGRVTLLEEGRSSPEVRYAVVTFTPQAAVATSPPAPADDEPLEIVTVRKEFQPRVAIVPLGATVSFPNQDPILHNVFSVTAGSVFDLGLVRQGESGEATFDQPGVVRIFCNVHHSMVAYAVVTDSPHTAYVDRQGGFRLEGVPAGPGTLRVWHERAEPVELLVDPRAGEPVAVELVVTKPRIPTHSNKFGRPYSRNRRGRGYG